MILRSRKSVSQLAVAKMESLSSALMGGPIVLRSWESDARQFIHRRERRCARNGGRRRRHAEIAYEVTEARIVVDEQDPRLGVTDHSERVRHAPRHRLRRPIWSVH